MKSITQYAATTLLLVAVLTSLYAGRIENYSLLMEALALGVVGVLCTLPTLLSKGEA